MTPFPPSDDDLPSLIKKYNSLDRHLRSEFLDAIGTTGSGWRAVIAAYERRRAAAGRQTSSNDARTEESSSTGRDGSVSSERKAVVIAVRLTRATEFIELLLEANGGTGNGRSRRYRSAPPSQGFAVTGPGRRSSVGDRRLGRRRGRSGGSVLRIVITLSEK
ncbi:hypothetical protein ACIQWA_31585 [Kitasatospora sp. NPDC098652]|uniref:hypothetical protein n=1 Tax=Kitasatospora sp. NPDC098652 TaxID=3364095 RepID=UPI00381D63CD